MKLLKEQPTPILGPFRILLGLSSSCLVWTGIVPVAWFLTFSIELDNCTVSYNSSEVMGLAGAGMAVVVLGVVLWGLIVFGLLKNKGEKEEEREVRYREVGNVQTEDN